MNVTTKRLPFRLSSSPFARVHDVSRGFATSRSRLADHARIVEVGPRDGLQNEKTTIPLGTKLDLIRRLAGTGVTHIEAGSFVPAKWVPQMASTAEIFQSILDDAPSAPHAIAYNYLVPNTRGMEKLVDILEEKSSPSRSASPDQGGASPVTSTENPNDMHAPSKPDIGRSSVDQGGASPVTSTSNPNEMSTGSTPNTGGNTNEISLFAAATEAFSQANTNCSIAESLERSKPIISLAKSKGIRVRGYVSVALGCPYEGPDVDPHVVAQLTASLLEMGCDEVSVADTTGMGTAPRTRKLLQTLSSAGILNEDLALHFHDTYGQALVNTMVGLEHGIRTFDSSVGGLGGCPYSKGASGNIATEDLIHTMHSLGVQTGVNLEQMAEIGDWISKELGRSNDSRAGKATLARLRG